jgi:hypothetical protein
MTMEHLPVTIAKDTARELWRAYQKHKHYSTPIDKEIMSAYQKLAQGKLVIKALESIVAAGVGDDGLPKLAITRADATHCHLQTRTDGVATMHSRIKKRTMGALGQSFSTKFSFKFPQLPHWKQAEAIVPIVPLGERPKRAMMNYHILWEAEWSKAVPVDPFLLRRIGKSDLWLVLAMWDLTDVERAALAARL